MYNTMNSMILITLLRDYRERYQRSIQPVIGSMRLNEHVTDDSLTKAVQQFERLFA